jgi:hypothetical protein
MWLSTKDYKRGRTDASALFLLGYQRVVFPAGPSQGNATEGKKTYILHQGPLTLSSSDISNLVCGLSFQEQASEYVVPPRFSSKDAVARAPSSAALPPVSDTAISFNRLRTSIGGVAGHRPWGKAVVAT